jgi:putative transposase
MRAFGGMFTDTVTALGREPLLTAYTSPWQNRYAERPIGGVRSECLDHEIILNETHLRGILEQYVRYDNAQRTHLGINKDSPEPRGVQTDGQIDTVAVVKGLHYF